MHFIILGFFFCCFRNLCSWIQPHLGNYFSFGCYSLLYLEIVQYPNLKCVVLSNLDGNIIVFNVFSMFSASVNRRRHPLHFWRWKEPRQYTHWDLVETNVWHT